MLRVLEFCHSSAVGGYKIGIQAAHRVLQCGNYLLTFDQEAHDLTKSSDRCQRECGISKRQEFLINHILVIEKFDVWELILWDLL